MEFYTRKLIKPEDLNSNDTLFGGILLKWIDEEAGIFVMDKLKSKKVVTKYISDIDFVSSAKQGDIIEIGIKLVEIGRTSMTLKALVRNLISKKTIISIEKLVFVNVDQNERPIPHGMAKFSIAV